MTGDATARPAYRISGGWDGTVALRCPSELARRAASVIFEIDPAAVGPDDMRDAIAELVNMTGGNLKPLLSEPCQLSLPVAQHGEGDPSGGQGRLVDRVGFECEGSLFDVMVFERQELIRPADA